MNMKKTLLLSLFAFMAIAFNASAQNNSTHSITLRTLYGLEYSYEHQWNSGMSLIGRVGGGSEMYGHSMNYVIGKGFNVMIEPRYYLNDEDFFSVKVNGAILIPNTPFDVSLVPVYGIKREYNEHWFCEFTIGGGAAYHSGYGGFLYFKPHLQFRIGFQL